MMTEGVKVPMMVGNPVLGYTVVYQTKFCLKWLSRGAITKP